MSTPTAVSASPKARTREQVARLFHRAAFGATVGEIDQWATKGYGAAVEHLLSFQPSSTRVDDLGGPTLGAGLKPFDDLGAGEGTLESAQRWWLNRMATTSYPLEEKLTLYWHGHFATGGSKVHHTSYMLRQSSVLRALAAAGVTSPLWLRVGDAAALEPGVRARGGRKLLVLLLNGGNDGLNTVVPYTSAAYYARRPTLGVKPEAVLKLAGSTSFGLHPSLRTVRDLYGKGQVAIVQGVGYDDPNLSHFESMDIWQTASPTREVGTGWLGRWLDATPDEGRPIRAAAIGNALPALLVGASATGVAIPSFNGFTFYDGIDTTAKGTLTQTEAYRLHQAFLTCVSAEPTDPVAAAYTKAGRRAVTAVRAVNAMSDPAKAKPPATLADQISMAVRLLSSNLGVEIAFVSEGSFDTHAGQLAPHAKLLTSVDDAVGRFVQDSAATGHASDYLLLTVSEFGRRPEENGSGTDHGTAAPLFAVGPGAKGGMYGQLPKLEPAGLDENKNLVRTVELREVFATVVERWLGRADAKDILRYSDKDGIHPIAFLR